MNYYHIKLLIAFIMLTVTLFSTSPIAPDSSFGTDGLALAYRGTSTDMAIQADGKIVLGGTAHPDILTDTDLDPDDVWVITRLNSDGSVDSSFGEGGNVFYDVSPPGVTKHTSSGIRCIAVQPDGKIIVAGHTIIEVNEVLIDNFVMLRFHVNGTIDESFGEEGMVTGGEKFIVYAVQDIAFQADGSIIAAISYEADVPHLPEGAAIMKFDKYGRVDHGFGTEGVINVAPVGMYTVYLKSILINEDGKILTGGTVRHKSMTYDRVLIARYNEDGTPDMNFGDGGIITNGHATQYLDIGHIYALAVNEDKKIIAAGSRRKTMSPGPTSVLIRLYNEDGTPDMQFGSAGEIILDKEIMYGISKMVLQPDGKIVTLEPRPGSAAMSRYHSDGKKDSSFGKEGSVIDDLDGKDDIRIQKDGKIIVSGTHKGRCAAIRYTLGSDIVEFPSVQGEIYTYPNPVDNIFNIEYKLNIQGTISLRLVDINGNTVVSLIEDEERPAGTQEELVRIPDTVGRGLYFLVLAGPDGQFTTKITKD